jgi:hypothetical protein
LMWLFTHTTFDPVRLTDAARRFEVHHQVGPTVPELTSRYSPERLVCVAWSAARDMGCRLDVDYPEEPINLPTEAACRNAIDRLIGWCRSLETTAAGSGSGVGGSRLTGAAAEAAVRDHLGRCPNSTIRQISEGTNISTGRISGMQAWREVVDARHAQRTTARGGERQLTERILANVGAEDPHPAPRKRSRRPGARYWPRLALRPSVNVLRNSTPTSSGDWPNCTSSRCRMRAKTEPDVQPERSARSSPC